MIKKKTIERTVPCKTKKQNYEKIKVDERKKEKARMNLKIHREKSVKA